MMEPLPTDLQPKTPIAPAVAEPMVEHDTITAFITNALTTGVRQGLLFAAGMAAAHGLVPKDVLSDTQAQIYAGIGVAVIVSLWGQYKAAHRKSKLIVALDAVDDTIGKVFRR